MSRPIRILQLLADNQPGGGMIQMHQFARCVDRGRFEIGFALPPGGPLPDSLRDMGQTVHDVDLGSRFSVTGLRRLTQLCRDRQVDVLHSHNVRANVHARVAGRRARVRARVSTIHNSVYHYDVSRLHRHVYAAAERSTLRWCDRVIAVSEGIAAQLRSRYRFPPERITVVPNGVDPDRLVASTDRATIRSRLGLAPQARALVQVGRLTPQKGYDVLFEAVARLRSRFPEIVVLAVGDGPLRSSLEALAAGLGIDPAVRFLGHREDVADLLHAADLVTLASRSEGMPYTLLEAMGAGRAVVATRIGGIEEVIRQEGTARLVPAESPEALAEAVAAVLEDPEEASRMGAAARDFVLRHHTAAGMVDRVQGVYLDLLAAPSGS